MRPELVLVRHGETAWSLVGRHTGDTDISLTPHGEHQVRHLGTLLRNVVFTDVLTSPLQRARRTCELAGVGDRARVESKLREWNYGDYEGRTTAEIRAQRPDWNLYRDGCPGGESPEDIATRADLLLSELRTIDGRVAIFSHGHFLRVLAMRWIGVAIANARYLDLETGSLSVLAYEHRDVGEPAISMWNAASNDMFDLAPHEV